MARTPALLLLSLIGVIASAPLAVHAQGEYVLKNGQRYSEEIVKPNGSAFIATVPVGDNRQLFNFGLDDIDRLNFPEPDELAVARRMVATGKSEDAVALLQKSLPPLVATRRVPGSWWPRGIIVLMDAYATMGKNAEMESEASQALQANLPEAQTEAVRNMLAMLTPPTANINDGPEAVKALALATDDSWFAARCWIEYANLLSRRGRTEEAVKAWLRAPVFHPAERDLAARGTILAARGLQQMDRAADGLQLIEHFIADNIGSQYSEVMKIEAAKLNPALLKTSKPKASDTAAPAGEPAPAPAAGTPTTP